MKHRIAKALANEIAITLINQLRAELQAKGFEPLTTSLFLFFENRIIQLIYTYLILRHTETEILNAKGYAQNPFKEVI